MPIKKDGNGKRWVEMELVVPGTPEQVWQAMATGPGYTGWFVRAEVEPRVGGRLTFDFGEGAQAHGEVTAWEPPHHFGYVEREWDGDAPPVATEIAISSRSGDRCLVRMVHSLFTELDDWDDQMEGFESGWVGFFEVLRVYLAHFAGAPAAQFVLKKPTGGDALTAWARLCDELGLAGANVGERRTSTGPEAWTGVVERVSQDAMQRDVLVRVDGPTPGVVIVGTYDSTAAGTSVSLARYYYGEDAATHAAEGRERWRLWLDDRFAGATPAGALTPN